MTDPHKSSNTGHSLQILTDSTHSIHKMCWVILAERRKERRQTIARSANCRIRFARLVKNVENGSWARDRTQSVRATLLSQFDTCKLLTAAGICTSVSTRANPNSTTILVLGLRNEQSAKIILSNCHELHIRRAVLGFGEAKSWPRRPRPSRHRSSARPIPAHLHARARPVTAAGA